MLGPQPGQEGGQPPTRENVPVRPPLTWTGPEGPVAHASRESLPSRLYKPTASQALTGGLGTPQPRGPSEPGACRAHTPAARPSAGTALRGHSGLSSLSEGACRRPVGAANSTGETRVSPPGHTSVTLRAERAASRNGLHCPSTSLLDPRRPWQFGESQHGLCRDPHS